MSRIKEGNGTLLDTCLIHYGAGMGAEHDDTDLPNLIVGGGGGLKHAGHLDYRDQPLANLYLRMLHAAGMKVAKFADSTGPLEGI